MAEYYHITSTWRLGPNKCSTSLFSINHWESSVHKLKKIIYVIIDGSNVNLIKIMFAASQTHIFYLRKEQNKINSMKDTWVCSLNTWRHKILWTFASTFLKDYKSFWEAIFNTKKECFLKQYPVTCKKPDLWCLGAFYINVCTYFSTHDSGCVI